MGQESFEQLIAKKTLAPRDYLAIISILYIIVIDSFSLNPQQRVCAMELPCVQELEVQEIYRVLQTPGLYILSRFYELSHVLDFRRM